MNKNYDEFFSINEEAFEHLESVRDNFIEISDVKTSLTYNYPNKIKNPLFSIVIPTYSRDASLRKAIQSVLEQKGNSVTWELLIVDNTQLSNFTTTPAYDYCKQLNHPNISYVHNDQNIGSGYNWNRGVLLSKGKWIIFLHDDDVLYYDALHILSVIIEKNPHSDKIGYISNRHDIARKNDNKIKCTIVSKKSPLVRGFMKTGAPTCGTCVLRDAYIGSGGINYDYGPSADSILAYNICTNYLVLQLQMPLGSRGFKDNASSSQKVRC